MSQVNEHPSLETPPSGSIRFNTDSSKLENTMAKHGGI